MRFLRVMLLVALVGLPCVRANLADRVVPEEQFYDDSSEAAFSTKAGDHEQTRGTRVDAEEGKFERIQELLSSLKGSISNEQLQCDSKQQADEETCKATKTASETTCTNNYNNQWNLLDESARTTRETCTGSTTKHSEALAELEAEQQTNSHYTAQFNQAASSLASMVAHGSSELAKCEASANAAHQRLMEYVNQTKATNEQHLNEAKEAIITIQQKIQEFSDTHNDTFSPATSLVQSLPMQHRIQLNLLAIKYIAADRASVHSMGNVSAILDRISASIVAQQQVVDNVYEQDTQQAQQELSAELARCAGVQTATVAGSTSREDDLQQKKETSDAKLLADVGTEADARSQKVSDCAAAAAAQSLLESETIRLTAQRTSCFNAAESTYSGCSSAASTSLTECTDYLDGETNIITRILDEVLAADQHHPAAPQDAGNLLQAAAGQAIWQAAERFIRHTLKRQTHGKVAMTALYVSNLKNVTDSDSENIYNEIITIVNNLNSTARADKGTETERAATLSTENDAERTALVTQATTDFTSCETKYAELTQAALDTMNEKSSVLDQEVDDKAAAEGACTVATNNRDEAVQARDDGLPVCTQTLQNAISAADTAHTQNGELATSKRDASMTYLTEERQTVDAIRGALDGLNKNVSTVEMLQDQSLTATQAQAVVSLVALAGQYNNEDRAGYAGSNHGQQASIDQLLDEIENTITNEETKVASTFTLDMADIDSERDTSKATAGGIHDGCVSALETPVSETNGIKLTKCGEPTATTASCVGDSELCVAIKAHAAASDEMDAATAVHQQATTQETIKVAECAVVRTAQTEAAEGFHTDRKAVIDADLAAELERLETTIDNCEKIVELVEKMQWSEKELLQAKASYSSSYRTASSTDEKSGMEQLLSELKAMLSTEEARVLSEYNTDLVTAQADKQQADTKASELASQGKSALSSAVQQAQAAFEAAAPELEAATNAAAAALAATEAATGQRQECVAKQLVNTPQFEQELEKTTTVAEEVKAKHLELHLKCEVSTDYLEISNQYVEIIKQAVDGTSCAASTHDAVTNKYTERGTADKIQSSSTPLITAWIGAASSSSSRRLFSATASSTCDFSSDAATCESFRTQFNELIADSATDPEACNNLEDEINDTCNPNIMDASTCPSTCNPQCYTCPTASAPAAPVAPAVAAPCLTDGTWFLPLDMPDQGRTVATPQGCEQRCQSTTGCKYFNNFPDGGCHITTGDSGTQAGGGNPTVRSGSKDCSDASTEAVAAPVAAPVETVGDVVEEVLQVIRAEEQRLSAVCDAHKAKFTKAHEDTMAAAQALYDQQIAEDQKCIDDAQQAIDDANLSGANARKAAAEADSNLKKIASTTAISARTEFAPQIDSQLTESLRANQQAYDETLHRVQESKQQANDKYAEQRTLIEKVEQAINDGVDKPAMLIVVGTAVKNVLESRLLGFNVTDYAHTYQDTTNGTYSNSDDTHAAYNAKTVDLIKMIDDLSAANTAELGTIDTSSAADVASALSNQNEKVSNANTTYEEEKERLSQAVTAAQAAVDSAQAAVDQQLPVKTAADADAAEKQQSLETAQAEATAAKQQAAATFNVCVQNAQSAYDADVKLFDETLQAANSILDQEEGIISQVREWLTNSSISKPKPTTATFNKCAIEKATLDGAQSACNDGKESCAKSKTENAVAAAAFNVSIQQAVTKTCEDADIDCQAASGTRVTYDQCIEHTDAHGCATSAGLGWCASKAACVDLSGEKSACTLAKQSCSQAETENAAATDAFNISIQQVTIPECVDAAAKCVCISDDAALLSMDQKMKLALVQLSAKYLSETSLNYDTFDAQIGELDGLMDQILAKIQQERAAAVTLRNQDEAEAATTKQAEEVGCMNAQQTVIDYWDEALVQSVLLSTDTSTARRLLSQLLSDTSGGGVIPRAQQDLEVAVGVQLIATNEYNRLSSILQEKQGLSTAVVQAYASGEPEAMQIYLQAEVEAQNTFVTERSSIESIARSNKEYIQAELEALVEIKAIVVELDL